MNIHAPNATPEVESETKAHLGFVDCDIHPMFKSASELQEFLPQRWRDLAATVGRRSRGPFARRRPTRASVPATACVVTPGPRTVACRAPTSN